MLTADTKISLSPCTIDAQKRECSRRGQGRGTLVFGQWRMLGNSFLSELLGLGAPVWDTAVLSGGGTQARRPRAGRQSGR